MKSVDAPTQSIWITRGTYNFARWKKNILKFIECSPSVRRKKRDENQSLISLHPSIYQNTTWIDENNINKTNKQTRKNRPKTKSVALIKKEGELVWNDFLLDLSIDCVTACGVLLWCAVHTEQYLAAVPFRLISFRCVHFGINIVWNVIFRLFYLFVSHDPSFLSHGDNILSNKYKEYEMPNRPKLS